jgi:serine O-acetyltransferase
MNKLTFSPSKQNFLSFFYKRLDSVDLSKEFLELNLNIDCELLFNNVYKRFENHAVYKSNELGFIKIITGHYCQFCLILYELGKFFFNKQMFDISNKIYFLNVSQISFDLPFEIDLPINTHIEHPIGSIISRHTKFNQDKYFCICSNCTIGGNLDTNGVLIYPKIEGNLVMLNNSSLIGNTTIRGNVLIANSSYIKDEGILKDIMIFGSSPNLIKKDISVKAMKHYFYI